MGENAIRLKGVVIGMASNVVGLLVMKKYWELVAPKVKSESQLDDEDIYPDDIALDDIAISEQQYKEGESSSDALGRILYFQLTGKEPRYIETKDALSQRVHWGYGILQDGLYGAFRSGNGKSLDLTGGALYGSGLWLLGDEAAVPMLGLQAGPTAVSPASHINRWGAHLAYGLTTAATTQLLHKFL